MSWCVWCPPSHFKDWEAAWLGRINNVGLEKESWSTSDERSHSDDTDMDVSVDDDDYNVGLDMPDKEYWEQL